MTMERDGQQESSEEEKNAQWARWLKRKEEQRAKKKQKEKSPNTSGSSDDSLESVLKYFHPRRSTMLTPSDIIFQHAEDYSQRTHAERWDAQLVASDPDYFQHQRSCWQ
mmetsp:Transcript_91118/g.258009  ORF Transcript_91118/g.258009 Transcript_91118/m.258009 type:complete len:109 (+) Transcript_91118:143-469(+)